MNQNEKAHRICEATAKEHGYTARELMPTVGYGSHPACLARQWAMYELREQLAWSWQRIATFFGRDNHSTALLAHKKIKKLKTIMVSNNTPEDHTDDPFAACKPLTGVACIIAKPSELDPSIPTTLGICFAPNQEKLKEMIHHLHGSNLGVQMKSLKPGQIKILKD